MGKKNPLEKKNKKRVEKLGKGKKAASNATQTSFKTASNFFFLSFFFFFLSFFFFFLSFFFFFLSFFFFFLFFF